MSPIHRLRAAYYLGWTAGNHPSPADGVRKKIGAQIRRWKELGVEVRLFVLARTDCEESWLRELEPADLVVHVEPKRWRRMLARRTIVRQLAEYSPDFVYVRQERIAPSLLEMVTRWPTFIELNGDDVAEARQMSLVRSYDAVYRAATRPLFFARAAGLVAVSADLAKVPAFARHAKPTVVIGNGTDLSAFRELPPTNNTQPRFAFIGASLDVPWHGVDKILELARKRSAWSFELIGEPGSLGQIPSNVTLHGAMSRAQYEPILARCDVGLGTLSAYVKQAWEASPLKIREYLAYGLPTITGVKDTDFPEGAEFLMTLPNSPDNVRTHEAEMERFAQQWMGKRVPRSAVACLDTLSKERQRIDFIQRVVREAK